MIIVRPQFCLSASVAFTVAGKLLQRYARRNGLRLRLTYECGGHHRCLWVQAGDHNTGIFAFNLDSGKINYPAEPTDYPLQFGEWPEADNYLLAFASENHGLMRVVEDIGSMFKLNYGHVCEEAGVVPLTIGQLLGRFLYDSVGIRLDNGWVNESGFPDWLRFVPEDAMPSTPYDDSSVQELWFLGFRDRSVVLDDEVAYFIDTKNASATSKPKGMNLQLSHVVVTKIEDYLRGRDSE
jgi:hypothetical protein